jgi:hypothetical protein
MVERQPFGPGGSGSNPDMGIKYYVFLLSFRTGRLRECMLILLYVLHILLTV